MKKLISVILALALALGVCSVSLADTEGADLTGKKVGFSALMMSSEFFTDMSNQMQAYFEERGMEYSVADANGDPRPRSRPSRTSSRWAWTTSSASWWTGFPSPTP